MSRAQQCDSSFQCLLMLGSFNKRINLSRTALSKAREDGVTTPQIWEQSLISCVYIVGRMSSEKYLLNTE